MADPEKTSFTGFDLPVREELRSVCQLSWQRLAEPGNWFSGEQRVAIAAESRAAQACNLCRERKDSLSPASVSGNHDSLGNLPESVVEIVHRVITDQGRITRHWVEGLLQDGINGKDAQGEYVEIVGLVVLVFSIDEFMRGIGAPLEPLPELLSGEPSLYRPSNLESETGFVPMIPADGNTDEEADLWGEMTANVLRALSLVPDCVRHWIKLSDAMYVPLKFMAQPGLETGRAIDRMQVELVAGRVSSHNECFYWTTAHSMALRGNAQAKGKEIEIQRVISDDDEDGGIDHGHALAVFVDAFMSRDSAQMDQARTALVNCMGTEGMVETAAVAGNFQRMVRIADCIGIPIDDTRFELSTRLRDELGINIFHSAQNTLSRH